MQPIPSCKGAFNDISSSTHDRRHADSQFNTQESYIQQVSLFARHFNKSPELLEPEHIRAYQVYLTNEKELSAKSIAIAISALRFVYRVTLKKDWSFEFIGRFLLHVLPSGFHRIRYYGFLANPHRKEKLEHCRQLLGMAPPRESSSTPVAPEDYRDRYERLTGHSLRECPVCHRGHMNPVTILAKVCSSPAIQDTS